MSRTITVTSGKGGVGKTNIALNLAVSLAAAGKKVCLFDVDLGLANINILLGLYPKTTLQDIIFEGRQPRDIIIRASGIDILPGSSGIEEIANLDASGLQALVDRFADLAAYDFIVFDTSAGIARNVMAFCLAASELVMIVTPEPTSLTDAYALLKVMKANGFQGAVKTVINNCKDPAEAKETYLKFKNVVDHYLALPVQGLGPIYRDNRVTEAVRRQKPFVELFPDSIAARCLNKISERLLTEKGEPAQKDYLVSFWQRCLDFFSSPMKMPGEKKKTPALIADGQPVAAHPPVAAAAPGNRTDAGKTEKAPVAAEATHEPIPGGVGEIWEVLVEGVMNISQELRLLRESVDKLLPAGNVPQTQESQAAGPKDDTRIVLDLDAYVQKQQGDREN